MASDLQNFPFDELTEKLISSFPKAWQGLFAALNVEESLAIVSASNWLRSRSSNLFGNEIPPLWSTLLRSLCLEFPVLFNKFIFFQPKFACFSLNLQRNMLSFILYSVECIPVHDIKVCVLLYDKSHKIRPILN